MQTLGIIPMHNLYYSNNFSTCVSLLARLRFTFRWEGKATSTNCSSHVNCCATLRTYLAQLWEQREQISKLNTQKTARPSWQLKPPHGLFRACECPNTGMIYGAPFGFFYVNLCNRGDISFSGRRTAFASTILLP